MRLLSLARVLVALLTLALVAGALYVFPSNKYYVFVPDRAHALSPLVKVPGGRAARDRGGIYFVDVRFRKARLLERLLGTPLSSDSSLVRVSDVRGPNVSESQQRRADLHDMALSQRIAAAVALNRLGYAVRTRSTGVLIDQIDPKAPAARTLKPADKIIAVDGATAKTIAQLRRQLSRHRVGQTVQIRYVRNGKVAQTRVRTVGDGRRPPRAIIGILPAEDIVIQLPIKVRIDTGGVGGPSAGLAFALDLMEQLGRDVDHGYKVAATGALTPDGLVHEIGGVQQKTVGARQAGVDVFLVPAGANARDARRYAHGLRIIAVKSFPQALRALATLPPRSQTNA